MPNCNMLLWVCIKGNTLERNTLLIPKGIIQVPSIYYKYSTDSYFMYLYLWLIM